MLRELLSAAGPDDPLGDFMLTNGGIVGGAIAFGTALGFIGAAIARDLGWEGDSSKVAQRGAEWGSIAGVGIVIARELAG